MMEHQKHVVCVGQALVDCITRGMEEKPYKKNVYRADSISLNTGGDALNESIVLSHLGHQVSLVCAVGDDLAGHIVLHTTKFLHFFCFLLMSSGRKVIFHCFHIYDCYLRII